MALDPVDAALDAIAAHLAGQAGIASALRGWPEHGKRLDLSAGPVVSVVQASEPERELVPPTEVGRESLGDGRLRVLYEVALVRFDVQLDLWARHRATRDHAALIVERALHNRIPWRTGLELTSDGYHGRPLSIEARGGFPVDDDESVSAGEWRQRWTLRVLTDEVVPRELGTQQVITLRTAIDGSPPEDHDITS